MSVSKVAKDIQLLQQQLQDLDTTISDPIERNEYKKELEKKLKKLERTKTHLEQLEKEQQELESLKSEFTSSDSDSIDKKESAAAEDTGYISESIPSVTDNSVSKISRINLNKQLEDSWDTQVKQTDSWEENSDTIHSTSLSSNESKKSAKLWIFSGIIGFFGLLVVIINTNKTYQTASTFEESSSESIDAEQSSSTQRDRQIDKNQNSTSLNENTVTKKSTPSSNYNEADSISTNQSIERRNTNNFTEKTQSSPSKYFDNYQFPLASCGDQDPGGTNTWYPVYVSNTERNLSMIKNNYCQDAIRKYREQKQVTSIQVASFTNQRKAEELAKLLQANIGSGEVGDPSVYNFSGTVNSSSSYSYANLKETAYHTNLIPTGNHSFYERGLAKMVSYQRTGNQMVGGVYDQYNPNVITCFNATISGNQVSVNWWNNLWQIGVSKNRFYQTYSVASFTADNGTPQPYLDNPQAVRQCN